MFRRDGYTCRYCGAKAPDVEITIDHVVPKVLGGSDTDPANLLTACMPCNSGKTSSTPDAPLVAAVSEDAVRWSAALKAASARMLADINARAADREQFRGWWESWTYPEGDRRVPIDMPADWESTVDQLLATGLPLEVLHQCIDGAMRRKKVGSDQKFRYMCGIAWRKASELRDLASALAGGKPATQDADGEYESDDYLRGRLDTANEILGEVPEDIRDYVLDACEADGDDLSSEAQHAAEAASWAIRSAMSNARWLIDLTGQAVAKLPDPLGKLCAAEAKRHAPFSKNPLSEATWRSASALYALQDLSWHSVATKHLATLTEEQQAEYRHYARSVYGDEVCGERWEARAYKVSQIIAEGLVCPGMCGGAGKYTSACPERGVYLARIDGLACCKEPAKEHEGHKVCERHMEELIAGTFTGKSGASLSATDFTEIRRDLVPF